MRYSVYGKTNVRRLPKGVEKIHLVRPIKFTKLQYLAEKKGVKEFSLSASTLKRLGEKSRKYLKEKNVSVKVENRRGRALELGFEKILKISDLKKDYLSLRKIEELTGTPKSTVHYLFRYADRGKVRKGSQTIYIE